MTGGTADTNQTSSAERHRARADAAADGFRVVSLAVISAFAVFIFDDNKSCVPSLELNVIAASALAGMILLGASWLLQKSKALARVRIAEAEKVESYLPCWLNNWWYDIAGFTLFLFGVSVWLLISFENALFFGALWAAAFPISVSLIRCAVVSWENSAAKKN